jgi:hypothetical protein
MKSNNNWHPDENPKPESVYMLRIMDGYALRYWKLYSSLEKAKDDLNKAARRAGVIGNHDSLEYHHVFIRLVELDTGKILKMWKFVHEDNKWKPCRGKL